jgi:dTDP-4-dehydrorhamnose reductase
MSKRILLVGGDETLGESLIRFFENNTEHELLVVTPDISIESETNMKFADIFDREKLKEICYELDPEIIINTAEYSGIKECELDKKKASDYNLLLTHNLVRIANILDARYIGFSSDLIFDGTETGKYREKSRPNPVNYYGKTKHAAENAIRTESIPWALIRTSSPFGLSRYGKKDVVYEVVENLVNGREVTLSDKLIRTPIYTEDLAIVVGQIVDTEAHGIINVSGEEEIDLYTFGKAIARAFGFEEDMIKNSENPNPQYPQHCGLDIYKLKKKLDPEISSAISALDALAFLYEQYGLLEKMKDKEEKE